MKPKIRLDTIHHGDCIAFLRWLTSGSVDLAVVDPPYNLSKADWDTFASSDAFFVFTHQWLDALLPTLKPGAGLYLFNTPYNAAFILTRLVKKGLTFQNWITWDKRDGLGAAKRKYSNGQETILYFTNGSGHTFNADAVRVPYQSTERIAHAAEKGILKNGKRWFPDARGRLCGEVWHYSSERHKTKVNGKVQKLGHATPKPLDMIERIITASSNPWDLVLDCFMGTGTTAVAATKLGRHFVGCEQNADYLVIAERRLADLKS